MSGGNCKAVGRTYSFQDKNRSQRRIWLAAAVCASGLIANHRAYGTNGTWTDTTSGGNWSTAANWAGNNIASGAGAIADFSTLTLPANNTVHLNASYTVGQLNFKDVGNNFGWTLDNNGSTANVLTLASGTSTAPVINVLNQSATIGASLAGTQGFTLSGGGILNLTGNSSYTGVTTVSNGTLVLSSAASSGSPTSGAVVDIDPQLSTITTSGGSVTQVSDISSGGTNSATSGVGSVTVSTINGHKALAYNGASGLGISTYSATTNPETVFAVIDPTTVTGPSAIFGVNDGGTNGGLELRLYNAKLDALNAAQADLGSSTSTVAANTLSVIAYTFNSSGGTFYLNGTAIGTTPAPSFTNNGTLLLGYKATNGGPSSGSSGEFFNGTMGTVLVYNSALSSTNIATTSSFLASEYAASSTTLGTTEVNLTSTSSNLAIASSSQAVSSLAGVAGSNVYLGGGIFTVGSDGTSTTFAGNISDTGTGAVGTGGQLIKTGAGTLNLSGGVSNTGGVQVNAGTLLISGTYSTTGATSVTAGTLSITGTDSDTGSHTITGGTLSISGTNSTNGPFTISNGGTLSLSGSSSASGVVGITAGGIGTIALIANSSNITGTASSAMGSPTGLNYANNNGTTNIQLRSDSSVTFTNSGPTGGTGGYPNSTIINYDVNNVGGGSTAANNTLTLGSTTAGASGFGTFNTNINVTGGNGYTMAIPAITNANNTFLNLNASTANLSIPGGITNVGPLAVSGASNTTLGAVTGAGPVTKTGGGSLSFTGSNTYTGATNISAGTLSLTSTAALTATSAITIAHGATLDISANPTFALPASTTLLSGSGTINGSYNHGIGILSPGGNGTIGTLTVNGNLGLTGGSVYLDISGSNNSTGGTANDLISVVGALTLAGNTTLTLAPVSPTLPTGTTWTVLTYGGSSPSGTGTLNVSTSAFSVISVPGAIELKYNSGSVGADLWTGSVNNNWDTSTTNFVASGTSSAISFTNGDNATFDDTSSVTNVNLTTALSPTAVTVSSNTSNYTFSGSGSITGTGSLSKTGASTLTVSISNTYSGSTNISGGTVILNNTAGVGLGTGSLFIGTGATLEVGDGGADGILNVGQNPTITNNGLLAYNSSSSAFSPPSPMTGTGGLYLNVASIGIGNQNNFSGGTYIAGGSITSYESLSFGTGPVVVNGGTIQMDFAGPLAGDYLNNFNLSGSAIHAGGSVTSIIGGSTVLGGDTTITIDNGAGLTFAGTVSAPGNNNLLVLANGRGVTFQSNVSTGTGNLRVLGTATFAPPTATTITVSTGGITDLISAGAIVQNGPGTTILNASNSYTGGTTVSAGTLVFNAPSALPNFSALTINANSSAVAANYSGGTKNSLFTSSLNIAGTTGAWTGRLDLTNNDLLVQAGNLATITNQVAQGFNNGAWNGSGGITSSIAAANTKHLTALGVIANDDGTGSGTALYGSFDGQSTVDGDVLVKYTYYGDTDLNGKVDGTDYSRIDSGYLSQSGPTPATGWFNGDFNYDGVINGSDYTLIDNAFNSQGSVLTAQLGSISATPTQEIAGTSSVPEPTTVSLLGIGAAGLLGRRGCRKGRRHR